MCLGLDEWKLRPDHIVLKTFSAVAPSASLCNRLHVSVCRRGRFDACRGVVTVTTKGRAPPGFVRLCRLSGRCGSMCFWDSYWTSTAQNICSVLRPNEKTTNAVKQPWGLIYPEFNQPLTPVNTCNEESFDIPGCFPLCLEKYLKLCSCSMSEADLFSSLDAEPKYLVAVQPIPVNDVKKHCTGTGGPL